MKKLKENCCERILWYRIYPGRRVDGLRQDRPEPDQHKSKVRNVKRPCICWLYRTKSTSKSTRWREQTRFLHTRILCTATPPILIECYSHHARRIQMEPPIIVYFSVMFLHARSCVEFEFSHSVVIRRFTAIFTRARIGRDRITSLTCLQRWLHFHIQILLYYDKADWHSHSDSRRDIGQTIANGRGERASSLLSLPCLDYADRSINT